jgi:hypothetical protein
MGDGRTTADPAAIADGPTAPAVGPSALPGPVVDHRSAPPGRLARLQRTVSPAHVVLGLLSAAWGWSLSTSVNDLDSYWHVLVGRQILADGSLDDLGRSWLGVDAPSWATSQWLSEVAMAAAVDTFGWGALVVGRDLLMVLLGVCLLATLVPRRPPLLVVPVFLALALLGPVAAQDRPQTVSFVFVVLVGAACVRIWDADARPPLLAVAGCSLLWAQLHGLWILAPAAFLLVATGALLDGGDARGRGSRYALLAAAASMAGLLNPLGLRSLLLPLELRSAASDSIAEWQRTDLGPPQTYALTTLLVLLVVAWARSGRAVPRVELLWGVAWAVFAALAHRNVAVSVLMLAPAVLAASDRVWGDRVRSAVRPSGRREGAALLAVASVLAVLGPVLAVTRAVQGDPLDRTPALQIARRLAASPAPVRVFNTYNASGALAAFGGGKVRLVVDGRADLWGADDIRRIVDAQRLAPGWERTVEDFRPDVLVLLGDGALTELLVREGDWRVDLRDGDYVLLVPAR